MNLLALDPSTVCIGYACFDTHSDPDLVDFGTFKPEGDDFSAKLVDVQVWLMLKLKWYGTDIMAFEAPVLHMNVQTLKQLAYFDGALWAIAAQHEVRVMEVMPGQRLSYFGWPIKTKRKTAKTVILGKVHLVYPHLNLQSKDHDIADAVAIGLAALKMLKQEEWEAQ